MLEECEESGGVIPCHSTIYEDGVQPAICRGFFEHKVGQDNMTLRLAAAMGKITEDPTP